jgi:hypothetical protein
MIDTIETLDDINRVILRTARELYEEFCLDTRGYLLKYLYPNDEYVMCIPNMSSRLLHSEIKVKDVTINDFEQLAINHKIINTIQKLNLFQDIRSKVSNILTENGIYRYPLLLEMWWKPEEKRYTKEEKQEMEEKKHIDDYIEKSIYNSNLFARTE